MLDIFSLPVLSYNASMTKLLIVELSNRLHRPSSQSGPGPRCPGKVDPESPPPSSTRTLSVQHDEDPLERPQAVSPSDNRKLGTVASNERIMVRQPMILR